MGVHADRALFREVLAVLGQQRDSLREGCAKLVVTGDSEGWGLSKWQSAIASCVNVRRKTVGYVGEPMRDPAKRALLARAAQEGGLAAQDIADDVSEFKTILDGLANAPKATVAQCRAALLAAAASPLATSKIHARMNEIRADERTRLPLFDGEPT